MALMYLIKYVIDHHLDGKSPSKTKSVLQTLLGVAKSDLISGILPFITDELVQYIARQLCTTRCTTFLMTHKSNVLIIFGHFRSKVTFAPWPNTSVVGYFQPT